MELCISIYEAFKLCALRKLRTVNVILKPTVCVTCIGRCFFVDNTFKSALEHTITSLCNLQRNLSKTSSVHFNFLLTHVGHVHLAH